MDIQITGHQVDVTEAITKIIETKLTKLSKHHPKITGVHVVLELNHLEHLVKATVHVPGGPIHAKCGSNDMYKSVDDLVDTLIKLLEKHKAKQ